MSLLCRQSVHKRQDTELLHQIVTDVLPSPSSSPPTLTYNNSPTKRKTTTTKKTTPVSFTSIVKDPPQPLSVDKCIPIKNAYINSFKQETKITSKEIPTSEIHKQWKHHTFKKGFWNFD